MVLLRLIQIISIKDIYYTWAITIIILQLQILYLKIKRTHLELKEIIERKIQGYNRQEIKKTHRTHKKTQNLYLHKQIKK